MLVQVAFRQSFLANGNANVAYVVFIGCYAVCALVTWAVYLRPSEHRLLGV